MSRSVLYGYDMASYYQPSTIACKWFEFYPYASVCDSDKDCFLLNNLE